MLGKLSKLLIDVYAKEKNIPYTVKCENIGHGRIKIDQLRVKQIVMNIFSNAVKFSNPGGIVEILVECYEKTDSNCRCRIVITDHGIGMSSDFIPRLYTPFEQEHRADSIEHHEGSGLGMSIAKRLAELMGGRIEAESTIGEGTKVTVYLDFERSNEDVVIESEMKQYSIPEKTRILLCEDNEINVLISRGILEKYGCIVECATNGREGLLMFQKSVVNYYQAILMDIRMPVMNGLDATEHIRSLERPDAGSIPIIALTANTFEDDIHICLEKGMNAHVAKPIDPGILLDTIQKFVTK